MLETKQYIVANGDQVALLSNTISKYTRYNVYEDCSGLLVAGGTTIESSWKVSRVRDS